LYGGGQVRPCFISGFLYAKCVHRKKRKPNLIYVVFYGCLFFLLWRKRVSPLRISKKKCFSLFLFLSLILYPKCLYGVFCPKNHRWNISYKWPFLLMILLVIYFPKTSTQRNKLIMWKLELTEVLRVVFICIFLSNWAFRESSCLSCPAPIHLGYSY